MTDRNTTLVSLVIPVCNEAASIPLLLDEIATEFRTLPHTFEVIVVDDGSTDGTWDMVNERAAGDRAIRGIRFRRNFGKTSAYAAGFAATRGEIVITLDGDLQDAPAEIPKLLDAMTGGLDLVVGWKKVRNDPWHKVAASRAFNLLVSSTTGVKLHDHNSGFRAMRGEFAREVPLWGERHRFLPVLAAARGYRVGEVPVQHRPRRFGRSHYGMRRIIHGLFDLVTVTWLHSFGARPMHFFGTLGIAFLLLALAIAAFAIPWADLAGNFGRTVLAASACGNLALAAFGSGCAGLLGELLAARMHGGTPHYSIRETTEHA